MSWSFEDMLRRFRSKDIDSAMVPLDIVETLDAADFDRLRAAGVEFVMFAARPKEAH